MRFYLACVLFLLCCNASAQQCTLTHGQVCKVHDTSGTLFYSYIRKFPAFDVVVNVTQTPATIMLWFNANVRHRQVVDRIIDYSFNAGIRGPVTSPALFPTSLTTPLPAWIMGASTGNNILGSDHRGDFQKYGQASFSGLQVVGQPGYYRIEIWGKSVTSACYGCDGLAEILNENPALNQLIVSVQ